MPSYEARPRRRSRSAEGARSGRSRTRWRCSRRRGRASSGSARARTAWPLRPSNLQIFGIGFQPCRTPSQRRAASRTEWAERSCARRSSRASCLPGRGSGSRSWRERWDVSPTPLREAVRTLAGEGLITLRAQRGARVAEVSAAEMEDVYATRMMLEPYVLRLSLERADDAWRAGLEQRMGRPRAGECRRPEGTSRPRARAQRLSPRAPRRVRVAVAAPDLRAAPDAVAALPRADALGASGRPRRVAGRARRDVCGRPRARRDAGDVAHRRPPRAHRDEHPGRRRRSRR